MSRAIKSEKEPKRRKKSRFFPFVKLLMLLIIAGGVFYQGWVQFALPEGTYGVIFTKTSGYRPSLLRAGRFVWSWERLFPTNMSLFFFPISSREVEFHLSYELPSGHFYASRLPEKVVFAVEGSYRVDYRIRPDSLPLLAENEGLRPDNLDERYELLDAQIQGEITRAIGSMLGGQLRGQKIEKTLLVLEDALRENLQKAFPSLQIISFRQQKLKLPDLALYEEVRRAYLQEVSQRIEGKEEYDRGLSEERLLLKKRLMILEEYGKLLAKYPSLATLVEKGGPLAALVAQQKK